MLLATPFINFEKVGPKSVAIPPRIISEIRKSDIGLYKEQSRPRLTGELLVRCSNDARWWPRKVSVRGGQLIIGPNVELAKSGSLRIPLRRLSVSAGPMPNSLSLIRGQNVVITIQTTNETSFDTWAKTIAIELIRQTPLEDIKYFDILTIDESWKRKAAQTQDINANHVVNTPTQKRQNLTSKVNDQRLATDEVGKPPPNLPNLTTEINNNNTNNNNRTYRRYMSAIPGLRYSCHKIGASNSGYEKLRVRSRSCNAVPRDGSSKGSVRFDQKDEPKVEDLLKKCQNVESYVPVKEKLLLFETLCRLGREVRSTEDVSLKVDITTKRAKSLHDLTFNSAPVKEICRYFEKRTEAEFNKSSDDSMRRDKRLISSDSNLVTKGLRSRALLKQ